jgi:hypothetical protein
MIARKRSRRSVQFMVSPSFGAEIATPQCEFADRHLGITGRRTIGAHGGVISPADGARRRQRRADTIIAGVGFARNAHHRPEPTRSSARRFPDRDPGEGTIPFVVSMTSITISGWVPLECRSTVQLAHGGFLLALCSVWVHHRIPILVPGRSNIKCGLPPAVGTPTEQRLGRSTDWHRNCFVSEDDPQKLCAEFLFSGHFRQILSTLTRNGCDSARLRDAEDGIVH